MEYPLSETEIRRLLLGFQRARRCPPQLDLQFQHYMQRPAYYDSTFNEELRGWARCDVWYQDCPINLN